MSSTSPRAPYAASVQSSTVNYSLSPRQIYVNLPLPTDQLDPKKFANGRYRPLAYYTSNQIRTSKYTILTFIPKNLFEQFRRVANSFFLLLIILQAFEEFQVIDPGVAAIPIIFIVAATAIKDGVEDWRRWKADKTVNNRTTLTLSGGQWRNYNFADKIKLSFTAKQVHRIKQLLARIKKINSNNTMPNPEAEQEYQWRTTLWKNLRVGDLVLLRNDDPIPADIVVLSTSETDCICYVETKNLDGETNLKLRQGPVETAWVSKPEDCALRIRVIIESEPPSTNMLRYQANLIVQQDSPLDSSNYNLSSLSRRPLNAAASLSTANIEQGTMKKIPIDVNGMLFRGAVLRNTKWVIGVVIFTGEDTKQTMNSGKTPSKRSRVEKLMNPHIIVNLVFLVFLCAICAIFYPPWIVYFRNGNAPFSLVIDREPNLEGFINFWTSLILFQNIVPISLYLSIEIAKTIQAYFIYQDIEMYYEKNDTPCQPKSWNLADNLGQIEYIFSDKTGTLTRNIMEFKKCSIDGVIYDGSPKVTENQAHKKSRSYGGESESSSSAHGDGNEPTSPLRSSKSVFSFKADWVEGVHELPSPRKQSMDNLSPAADAVADEFPLEPGCWFDPMLNEYLNDTNLASSVHGVVVRDFFTLLSVCHTVLVDDVVSKSGEEDSQIRTISYKAQSPDESCLVTLAAEMGFIFKGREQNSQTESSEVLIEAMDKEMRYTLLNVLEFDSDRKRMSVIVRTPSFSEDRKGDVILFCKGADSVIFERLLPGQTEITQRTSEHLEQFAQDGLRTLCLAYRKIPEDFYEQWSKRYAETLTTIFLDPSQRNKTLENLNNEVESKLILLGATAIEDKLQEGVPECIKTLSVAGIKIWVLTGDKIETAVNVGFLCGLLKNSENTSQSNPAQNEEMILIYIKNARSEEDVFRQLKETMERFFSDKAAASSKTLIEHALIIDGQSLKFALENDIYKELLLEISCRCKAVICCRVSPLQKAKVVEMVKHGKQVLTLAIGDGANDVSMIQAADVGVGISGEEGLQAVMSADYAVAQFRFLQRLLLVHGRWSYSRIAFMVLNFYLKNIITTMVMFWFQFYCGFSASMPFEFSYMLLYNIVFTCLPVIILGIFDQDGEQTLIQILPQIYGSEGITESLFTHRKFALYFGESIWYSLVCFFVPAYTYFDESIDSSGIVPDMYYFGTVTAVAAILCANLSVVLDTHRWTWMSHVANWGTCALFIIYVLVYSYVFDSSFVYLMANQLYVDPKYYLSVVLCVVLSLGPRFVFYFGQRLLCPTDSQILEEIQQLDKNDKTNYAKFLPINVQPSSPVAYSSKSEKISKEFLTAHDPNLVRKLSNASAHSISFNMETGAVSTTSGFSFAHTRGMSGVILRSPIASPIRAVFSARSRRRSQSQRSVHSARSRLDYSSGSTTIKLSAPPAKGKVILSAASPLALTTVKADDSLSPDVLSPNSSQMAPSIPSTGNEKYLAAHIEEEETKQSDA